MLLSFTKYKPCISGVLGLNIYINKAYKVVVNNLVYLPNVLSSIGIVLFAFSSAQLIKSVLNGFPAEKRNTISLINNHVSEDALDLLAAPNNAPYGIELARMHLMGKVTETVQVQSSDAPNTKLNLKLNGVIALGDGQGFAIIQSKNRKHKMHQINSEIVTGVTLHSVFHDYVLISRLGLREKLTLPKADIDSRGSHSRGSHSRGSQRTFNPSDHDIHT